MIARISTLIHPNGSHIELPKAVPSFSSKGFPVDKKSGKSDVNNALKMVGPSIRYSLLISAYDIHKKYYDKPISYCRNKEMVIIDSGGYELSDFVDSTEPKFQKPIEDKRYTINKYEKILNKLTGNTSYVIANYDIDTKGLKLSEQIKRAKTLFRKFPKYLHSFVIKPSGKSANYINVNEIISHLDKMSNFGVIGITEKELGSNPLEQLKNIANLRIALNNKKLNIPIHIWGGLDPVITPLYFCAGAEIFDGVSWLRYGYYKDRAIPKESYKILNEEISSYAQQSTYRRTFNNLNYLEELSMRMRLFYHKNGDDFSMWENNAEVTKYGYDKLCASLPEVLGGE